LRSSNKKTPKAFGAFGVNQFAVFGNPDSALRPASGKRKQGKREQGKLVHCQNPMQPTLSTLTFRHLNVKIAEPTGTLFAGHFAAEQAVQAN
jgi:hypothetical protein